MSIAELYEMQLAMVEIGDGLFEQWITVTFAVLIAVTMGAKFLDTKLRVFVSVLYVLVSGYLAFRFLFLGQRMSETAVRLRDLGETYDTSFLLYSTPFSTLVFWTGVLGTLYMVWRRHGEQDT